MAAVFPVCREFRRILADRNSLKIPPKLRAVHLFEGNGSHFAIASQSLINRYSVVSSTRSFVSGERSVAIGFSTMSGSSGSDSRRMVEFRVSESCVLKIQRGDITMWSVDCSSDAIVNPANEKMLGGGGADGAIHRAAGPELRAACYKVKEGKSSIRCPTGEARITPGFRLPVSHVIHAVGPIYGMDKNSAAILRNAYRNSLLVANENNIQYVGFTAISCGVYGYPYEEAATVAISTIKEFVNDSYEQSPSTRSGGNVIANFCSRLTGKSNLSYIKEVHFVLFSDEIYGVWINEADKLLHKII